MTDTRASLKIRVAAPEDRDAIGDLAAAALDCDQDARTLPAVLAAGPDADPELQLVAVDHTGVVGAGVATAPPPIADSALGFVDFLAVSPGARGQGIGRALLDGLEVRLRGRGARTVRVGGNAPCYAWPGVDVRYTAMLGLLGSAGYRRLEGERGEAVNMAVALTGTPGWLDTSTDEARLVEAGIAVRRLTPGDPAFARFISGWGPKLAWEAEQASARRPSACHVATRTDNGEHVAFACHHTNRAGWFGPMGTDPSVRRLGIGSVLLRRCMRDLASEGREAAQISWVGPVGFYARGVGARINRVFWLFAKDL